MGAQGFRITKENLGISQVMSTMLLEQLEGAVAETSGHAVACLPHPAPKGFPKTSP